MLKTDTFFVISNYNTDPSYLLDYCKNYIVYDQSDKDIFDITKSSLNYELTQHTGHNITDYFKYFIDNYDHLPEHIALLKGNIVGRHVTQSFFDRVYQNKFYTFLYHDDKLNPAKKKDVFFLSSENEFLEINNSWYVHHHPRKYFNSYNSLLKFIYKEPLLPEYCLFSPGACYIISKSQVLKYSKQFYINLNKILGYTLEPRFPSEAHQIERMLHTIFTSNYWVNDHMNSVIDFDKQLTDIKLDEKPVHIFKRIYRKFIN